MKTNKRKNLHLKNYNYVGGDQIYFITICASGFRPIFDDNISKMIVEELEFRSNVANEVNLISYCVMPDHLHILKSLSETYLKSLQNWVSAFKRYTARAANELYAVKPLWQKNFYDHVVRKEESLSRIAQYIVENPVRKGMVSSWREYQYSGIADIFEQ